MMRQLFLFLSTQKGMRKWMETSPVAQKLTRRFVAGETLEDELAVCARLAKNKMYSTLDHLGENAKRELPSTVSIKLTQFGLDLSLEACFRNVSALSDRGIRIEVDMEST